MVASLGSILGTSAPLRCFEVLALLSSTPPELSHERAVFISVRAASPRNLMTNLL